MKTIEQWFNLLQSPVKEEAFGNTGKHKLKIEIKSLSDALLGAFVWGLTNQGYDYWEKIHDDIHLGEIRAIETKSHIKQSL